MLCSPKKKFSTAKFSQMYPRVGLIMKKIGFWNLFYYGAHPNFYDRAHPTLKLRAKLTFPNFCVAVDLKPIMTDNQKLFLLELPPNQKFQKKVFELFFTFSANTSLILIWIVWQPKKKKSYPSIFMDFMEFHGYPDQQFYKL